MGTGASKLSETASAQQKDQIGVFVLTRKESQAISVLSTILTKMLDANRLFDISTLLSTDDGKGCSSLFMVIENAIEKEFLRLKFPDPKVSSAITGISTVPTKYYTDSLEPRSARKDLCRDLTHFLVRLITLVAALASSIKSNGDLKSLMRPPIMESGETPINELKMTEPELKGISETTNESQIPAQILTGSFLKPKGDVYVIGTSNYAIRKSNMLMYNSSALTTPVFLVKIESTPESLPPALTGPSQSTISPQQSFGGRAGGPAGGVLYPQQPVGGVVYPQQPVGGVVYPQQPAGGAGGLRPNNATTRFSNANSIPGSRSTVSMATRRRRRGGRQTRRRRQHGGDNSEKSKSDTAPAFDRRNSIFRVDISLIGGTQATTFYVNALGDTYERNVVYYSPASREPVPKPVPFITRISELFQNASSFAKFETKKKEVVVEAQKEAFAGLQTKDRPLAIKAIEQLKKDFTELNKEKVGTAPAPYRAFLLASEPVGSTGILHMLCRDEWRNQWVTSVMTYSLFQGLYNDTPDGKMSPRNAEECRKMMKLFSQTGAMKESAPSGELATSFANMRFADLPDVFKASICAQTSSDSPTREESIPGDMAILRKAHHDIRMAYEAYIDKLIPFTMSVVRVIRETKNGTQTFSFRLDSAFLTTEGTSLTYLENKIAEARMLIGSHLLSVETIYADTIKALELSKKGILTTAP